MTDRRDWFELASAYALDALDADERAGFEQAMRRDPELRREVDALREVAARIGGAAPRVEPPEALRDRILADARSTSQEPRSDDGTAVELVEFAPVSTRSSRPWLAAAAATVIAVLLGLGYLGERGARETLEQRIAGLTDELDETRQELVERDATLAALLSPDIATASLAATDQAPSARLFWNRQRGTLIVTVFDLPAAASDRTYQLWGIDTAAGTDPVSLGTFDTGPGGSAILTLDVPGGASFDLAAVTEEPAGGSAQPTTTPFLVGTFGD